MKPIKYVARGRDSKSAYKLCPDLELCMHKGDPENPVKNNSEMIKRTKQRLQLLPNARETNVYFRSAKLTPGYNKKQHPSGEDNSARISAMYHSQ